MVSFMPNRIEGEPINTNLHRNALSIKVVNMQILSALARHAQMKHEPC